MNDKNRSGQNIQEMTSEALNRRVEALSVEILSELEKSRYAALSEESRYQNRQPGILFLGGAGGIIASVVMAVMLLIKPDNQAAFPEVDMELFELVAMTEELELYEEMDFYQWLEAQSVARKKSS